MKRRKFLTGSGALAAGGAAALGSGAFSRVEATRSVSIEVAEDPNGYLSFRPTESANGEYAKINSEGALEINVGSNAHGGKGVNTNAQTWFDGVFNVCNQGNEDACVSYNFTEEFSARDNATLRFYLNGSGGGDSDSELNSENVNLIEPGESIPVPVGECATVGMGINTEGVDASEDSPLASGGVQFTADVDGDCFGSEGSDPPTDQPGGGPGVGKTSISVDDQTSDGTSVTVSVTLAADGYISLHDMSRIGKKTRLGNGRPKNKDVVLGSLIAITDLLEAGTHEDVEVELFNEFAPFEQRPALNDGDKLIKSQPLVAIPHQNTADTGEKFREDPDNPGEQLGTFEARGKGKGDIAFFKDSVSGAGIVKTLEEAPVANDIATIELEDSDPKNVTLAKSLEEDLREGFLTLPAPDTNPENYPK